MFPRKTTFFWILLLSLSRNGTAEAPSIVSSVIASSVACEATAWRTAGNASLPRGEELNFVLRWGVITAGRATLSVRGIELLGSRNAYHLTSYARSTGVVNTFYTVQDHSEAWLDTQSLTTLRYEKNVREGSYRIQENADFDQPCRRFFQHSIRFDKNNKAEDRVGRLPADALDVFGCLYYMRTLPLEIGKIYTLDVLSGDKVWPLVVTVKRRETVKVAAGRFDCYVLEPVLRQPGIFVTKGKKVEVWVTADARRMPVRMRSEVVIGHVAAELTDYKSGDY
jgi:hypothetical protein